MDVATVSARGDEGEIPIRKTISLALGILGSNIFATIFLLFHYTLKMNDLVNEPPWWVFFIKIFLLKQINNKYLIVLHYLHRTLTS